MWERFEIIVILEGAASLENKIETGIERLADGKDNSRVLHLCIINTRINMFKRSLWYVELAR